MEPRADGLYTAFANSRKIASGDVMDVAIKVKNYLKNESTAQILIFDSLTSNQVEIDFRGSPEDVVQRLEALLGDPLGSDETKRSGPGRPKLGVTAKEVTLLPAHWEWLGRQPGGASVTLRRLVEEAKKRDQAKDIIRQAQESAHKFMTAMAGDLPNYEEALRALYAGEGKRFEKMVSDWPKDIRVYVLELAKNSFSR